MIIAHEVSRTFSKGEVVALDKISVGIGEGERVGVIGKNGAGKTTFLKLVAGILAPSGGEIWTFGKAPCRNMERNRRKMGFLFVNFRALGFYETLREGCEMQKTYYGVREKAFEEMYERIGRALGIDEFYERPLRELSVGEHRCAEFFHAMLHRPKLLLLDEPTIGVDERSKGVICETIKRLNEVCGTTVLIASHDMDTLEDACERCLLLKEGKLVFDGSWKHLRKMSDTFRTARFGSDEMLDFEDLPVQLIRYENGSMEVLFSQRQISEKDLYVFLTKKGVVRDFCVEEPPLETICCDLLK